MERLLVRRLRLCIVGVCRSSRAQTSPRIRLCRAYSAFLVTVSSNRKWRDVTVVLARTAMSFFAILIAVAESSAHTDMDAEVERIIVHEIDALMPANGAGGAAIAVRIASRTLFFNGGLADRAAQRPITTDSLFNIGSLRKLFEATLVADGMLRGELRLDDPVAKYVGELHTPRHDRPTCGPYVRSATADRPPALAE
jgi:beta-lactamase class C